MVQVLFSTLPVAGKVLMPAFGPHRIAFYRISGGALCFLLLSLWQWRAVPWQKHPRLIACALTGIAGNQILYLEGLQRSTPINATMIVTLSPIVTLLVGSLAGQDRVTLQKAAGMALGFAGVAVLVSENLSHEGLVGDLLLFGNMTLYSIYLVISRPLVAEFGPLAIISRVFLWSVPITLLFAGLPVTEAPPEAWKVLGYVVLGPTVATYSLNLVALKVLPPSTVAVFIQLQPVFTALLSWAVFGTLPGINTLIAGALSFTGVYLVSRAR